MGISWQNIFRHYNAVSKLEKVKKKIYFFLSLTFIIFYAYYIVADKYANDFDLYLTLFSLFFNVVSFACVIHNKTTKYTVIVSSCNDIFNTSLAIWFTGGPYSLDVYWYFTLILGLIVLVETRMGMIVAVVAFINLAAIFYAERQHLMPFKQDFDAIDLNTKMIDVFFVFVILFIIIFFVTKKDLYEEEFIQEKEENITTLEFELDKRMQEITKLRANIARDFHDVMGNKLASISSISQMLSLENNFSEERIKTEMARINSLSNEVFSGTKDFVWSLNIDKNNLFEIYIYIKDFGENLFNSSKIDFISYPISEEYEQKTISIAICSQLILIMKEVMTNALVHSKAQTVSLSLFNDNKDVVLAFEDNGIGFDPSTLNRINGLKNIQSRASESGLELQLTSQKDIGTKVAIVF
jgi:signal transduction histidine kinase